MRRVFLWAARNRWLKERLPRFGFMRRAVRRFMPGETMEDALAAAAPLQAAGIGTLYTRLGENLESLAEADEVAAHYPSLIDRIKAAGIDGEISVKPTQLGLDHDADACLAHLERLAAYAARPTARTCGSTWRAARTPTRRSRSTSGCARPRQATGICLQAYLRRTAADIERLLPLDPAIRLVKGAYDEPGVDRLPGQAARSIRTTPRSPSASCSTAGAGRSGSASGTHDVDAHRADRGKRRPGRGRARRLRRPDALRHPDRSSSTVWRRRAIGSRRSSRTATPGIRGTCAAWPSDRPT